MVVPCRRCMPCRIALTREWTTRLMHEALCHDDNCFVTLTYRTEELPEDRSLNKRILQLFIKRFRKKVKVKIKYYAVGDYGELNDREHYHLIIYGWKPPLDDLFTASKKNGRNYYGSRIISTLWPYGFNAVGTVTRDSCQYTCGYVRKKAFGQRGNDTYGKRLPPFALQSGGIGAWYAFQNRERIQEHLCVIEGNKNLGLPRYYQRLLLIDSEDLIEKRMMKDNETVCYYYEKGFNKEQICKLVMEANEQKEQEMLWNEKTRRTK